MQESGELGTWREGGEGWEEALVTDESHIVQESKFAIKESRRLERELKRQAQNFMRAQSHATGSHMHTSLGVKTV